MESLPGRVELIIIVHGELKLELDVQQATNCGWSCVHLILVKQWR